MNISLKQFYFVVGLLVLIVVAATATVVYKRDSVSRQLVHAVLERDLVAVQRSINEGVSPDTVDYQSGMPILLLAIQGHSLDISSFLINIGASVNASYESITPLVAAVQTRQKEMVRLLLERGAYVDATIKSGETALWIAAFNGDTAICELLLSSDANPNHFNRLGWTPLFAAAQRGHLDVALSLINHGAAIDANNGAGTPLHIAAANQQVEMVRFLLERGANVDAESKLGLTAMDVAQAKGDTTIARILQRSQTKP